MCPKSYHTGTPIEKHIETYTQKNMQRYTEIHTHTSIYRDTQTYSQGDTCIEKHKQT